MGILDTLFSAGDEIKSLKQKITTAYVVLLVLLVYVAWKVTKK